MVVHVDSAELNAPTHHLDQPVATVDVKPLGMKVQHAVPEQCKDNTSRYFSSLMKIKT